MKHIHIIITAIFSALLISCTEDFEEINTDPNSLSTAPLINMLAYTEYILAEQYGGTELTYPAGYVGHAANYRYTDEVNYRTGGPDSPWDYLYVNVLNNLEFIISEAESAENYHMQATAMVLRAYAYHLLVDMYGPVPYTEANKGDESLTSPKFDTEETIYLDLLAQLKTANELFVTSSIFNEIGTEDFLFGGNVSKWQKFANSLRLRLAIRISNVSEQVASTQIAEILGDPATYPVLSSNSDNIGLKYPTNDPNYQEPWSDYSGISQIRIGKPLIDTMNNYNDPRISYYASPSSSYQGLEIGAEGSTGGAERINNQFVRNDSGTVYLMKYCEIEFIKAEAFKRDLASGGSAAEAYEAGITASIKEYAIHDTVIDAYLSEPEVAWADELSQIYVQKWLSLFHQSWEAWAEMRRTDVPRLNIAINSKVQHDRIPFRFNYPSHVVSNNGKNIPAFVNEEDFYWGYQIWWDTRQGIQ